MIIAHLSVSGLPSEGASVGKHVRRAVEVIRASRLKHELHAMGTEVECETLDELFALVTSIDEALVRAGALRVTIRLKIDDRRDKPTSLASKVASAKGRPGPGT